ncbi:MAG: glycine cleavage system aminomethyltransferase GcvT [Phycisphaerae bacterium]|nr:glycine cleavage system aminomethyltransferase GcvT [Phycisphaerae bacterium]
MQGSTSVGQFVFEQRATEPGPSVLYGEHVKLTGKSHIAAFAGYLMPLWYSSIGEEHRAVRERAGLFDCTHMGVLEVSGADAAQFLNLVTTNEVPSLKIGRARYGYILDAAGNVLDDIIIYRRGETSFMVVVNASNEPKIKFYVQELMADRVAVGGHSPLCGLRVAVRDMRDPNRAKDRRVDIALQGPASIDTLAKLTDDASVVERVSGLKGFAFVEERLAGIDCLICRTGYTGSTVGFELFADPEQAPRLWNLILEAGEPLGVVPCGLGARDSLRIEAGLPLYGHELDGKFNISPFEAGYGWAVKLDKESFIGKAAMQRVAETYDMEVARIELPATRGVRPIRQDDPILDKAGRCAGWVLSAAKVDEKQYALAYVARDAAQEGMNVGVYYLARSQSQVEQGRAQAAQKGQKLTADLAGTVVSRFARF